MADVLAQAPVCKRLAKSAQIARLSGKDIGRLYAGSSGFSYPSWRGDFYPSGTKQKEFLRYYASELPAVEVNSTFYNLPSESTVAGWAEATPREFRFAIKMNRRIVQFGRVDLAAAFCERIRPLGERPGPVRVLIGRSRDDGWLRLLLDSLDPELDYAFEFCHESWGAHIQLAARGIVEVDDLESRTELRYLRLRKPPYDDGGLGGWVEKIVRELRAGTDVYCFFKHEEAPTAPSYAARLGELVQQCLDARSEHD